MDNTNRGMSSSLSSIGSATGSNRSKVALKPGRSLMDWIRLTHSGEDLTGVHGVLQAVTPDQLAQHNKETDCWLAIRGVVFNVTAYMEFHPGGPGQLMKGAGKDATVIFDEVHAYVNYTSLLQKCIVGNLIIPEVPRTNPGAVTPDAPKPGSVFKTPAPPTSTTSVLLPLDWYQTEDTIHIVFYTKIPEPRVKVQLVDRDVSILLTLCARQVESHFTLLGDVKWPCKISISDIGKVDIQFHKVENVQWIKYGSPCHGALVEPGSNKLIRRFIMKESYSVSHDTSLIVLQHENQCYDLIPIGHHILVHFNDDGEDVIRMYTPVPPCLPSSSLPAAWTPDCVCLMVKRYPAGAVSPRLHALRPGDSLQCSGPEGKFSCLPLRYCPKLHLIAAGTGITPMYGLIKYEIEENRKRCKSVRLLFFNRRTKDILWKDQLDAVTKSDERFSVQHVLSEPDADWKGPSGRINSTLLSSFLADADPESSQDYICVCGPTIFTQITREMLLEIGFRADQFHCFVG